MTDEELMKRLREGATWDDDIAAADRIGDLLKFSSYWHNRAETAKADCERIISEWAEVSQKNYQRAKAAEAKLAKAVKALRVISQFNAVTNSHLNIYNIFKMTDRARETLAELEGGGEFQKD